MKRTRPRFRSAGFLSLMFLLVLPRTGISQTEAEGDPAAEPSAVVPPAEASGETDSADVGGYGENGGSDESTGPDRAKVLDAAIQALTSPDFNTQVDAAVALRGLVKEEDLPYLLRVLRRLSHAEARKVLISAVGNLRDRRAAETLREELLHGRGVSRAAAARALGKLGSDWPIPYLYETMMKSDDGLLRIAAAAALAELASPRALQSLEAGRAGATENVRIAIDWALALARAEIDPDRVDERLERGKKIEAWYKGTKYFAYAPSLPDRNRKPWLMVVIHDDQLNAEEIFNRWAPLARRTGTALLVPFFDPLRFPDYSSFNIDGDRADLRLLELVDHYGKRAGVLTREMMLVGSGIGGDFVQRFVVAYPDRVAKAILTGSDFTLLNPSVYFPRGVKVSPLAEDMKFDLYRALKTDLMMVIRVTSVRDRNAARASEEFFQAIEEASRISGVTHRHRLEYFGESSGNSLAQMAEEFLFPKRAEPPKFQR